MKSKGHYILIGCIWIICQSCLDSSIEVPQVDPVAQFVQDTTIIGEYLNQNEIDAEMDSMGIRYLLHEPGTGQSPQPTDTVTVSYAGRILAEENDFDSGNDVTFPLGLTIIGWQIGMRYVKEGGSITLYIPSFYAYGSYGRGVIPPNAVLVFDIDLHTVNPD